MWYWWVVGILIVGIALYFLDREIYFYEATHLGPRVQAWFYDRWARKYDLNKKESIARDQEMLAKPVLQFLKDSASPLVLDLATGTGRLPLALLKEPDFKGHVVAVDVSAGMLAQAAEKLKDHKSRVTLLRQLDYPLAFPDSVFDVVSCMEALEVMPAPEPALAELFRILKPGGMLLTSRATDASGRKAKVRKPEVFAAALRSIGFEKVDVITWWRWFDRVIAYKPGVFAPSGRKEIYSLMVCPDCKQIGLNVREAKLQCPKCGHLIEQNEHDVLML